MLWAKSLRILIRKQAWNLEFKKKCLTITKVCKGLGTPECPLDKQTGH